MAVVDGAALLVLALKEEELDLEEEKVMTIPMMTLWVSTWWVRWCTWETSLGLLSTCLHGFRLML